MPLTPADVQKISFQRAALGRRGYDADEVDALREEIGLEMARLLAEQDALTAQLRRAGSGSDTATGTGPTAAQLAEVSHALNRELRARDESARIADGLHRRLTEVRSATAAPAPVVVDDRVLAMAQRTAEQHVQDAFQESEQVLGEARQESEQLVEQALLTARDIEQDALRRDDEAAAQLTERRSALQHEVAELTELAENYRAGLADDVRHHGEI
jgi:DivIVA domain-containing protein